MVSNYFINFTDPEVTPFTVNAFTSNGPATPTSLILNSSAISARTSLLVYGKGHPEYGERIEENIINVMENFSGASEPVNALSGQTWFDRITYVRTGGSPAVFYRWIDAASDPNEGTWNALTAVVATPITADEVFISATTPVGAIVNGAFWFQPEGLGSPATDGILYLGVNSLTSNISPASEWRPRQIEDFVDPTNMVGSPLAPLLSGVPDPAVYKPQKQLKVYDGIKWKNSGNVYTGLIQPLRPVEGDLWMMTFVGSPNATNGSQLMVYNDGEWVSAGYVDTGGDTMTGPLYFSSNGIAANASLIVGENLLTGTADIRAASDLNLQFGGILNVTEGGSPQVSVFQILNNGTIQSALPVGSPNTYTSLVVAGTDNTLVNKGYVAGAIAQSIENANNIETLSGGSPIEAKVNRSGDTMTGTLTFQIGSPQVVRIDTMGHNIDMGGGGKVINLKDPTSPQDAATKFYVDGIAAGSPVPSDGVLVGASWIDSTRALTFIRSVAAGSPQNFTTLLPHRHPTTEIDHTLGLGSPSVVSPYLRDLIVLGGSPYNVVGMSETQDFINENLATDINERVALVEAPTERQIFNVTGGSPTSDLTDFNLVTSPYVAGTNNALVYVNGVKQYANERGQQQINFDSGIGASASLQTGIVVGGSPQTFFDLRIAIDGGSPADVISIAQDNAQIIQQLVNQINIAAVGVTAAWNQKNEAITIYSDSTGTGSEIEIIDGVAGSPTTDLLGALDSTGVYTIGSITPAAGGPVSAVTQDLSYREVVDATSSTVDAKYGESSLSIVFNAALVAGADVVEVLVKD